MRRASSCARNSCQAPPGKALAGTPTLGCGELGPAARAWGPSPASRLTRRAAQRLEQTSHAFVWHLPSGEEHDRPAGVAPNPTARQRRRPRSPGAHVDAERNHRHESRYGCSVTACSTSAGDDTTNRAARRSAAGANGCRTSDTAAPAGSPRCGTRRRAAGVATDGVRRAAPSDSARAGR